MTTCAAKMGTLSASHRIVSDGLGRIAVIDGGAQVSQNSCLTPEATAAEIVRRWNACAAFVKAAEKFCAKVESGRARSRETYADLKACLALAKGGPS